MYRCWNKAFNGGHCAHLRNPEIYKKSLKQINLLHYQYAPPYP